jgi:ABC-type sugar transport system, ATPase component
MKGTAKMSEIILETRNLTKKYRNQYALKDVSISLKKNHIYGFIGENGAGKSTFMKIVAGLIYPTDGDMTLMGETDLAAIEKRENSWEP